MSRLMKILACQRGANAIEYSLLAALIAVAALLGMQTLGNGINTMFNNVSNKL